MRFAFAAVAIVAAAAIARDASASGGMFAKVGETAAVTEHRIVFKLGANETVLWDQLRYTGSPSEFAWVLPVHAGAQLELAHAEFLDTLDNVTRPTANVLDPMPCDNGGGGCSSSDEALGVQGERARAEASVVGEQLVGPYDVLTLHASGGQNVRDFLTQNGFAIPTSAILDAYAAAGFDFIAVRLRPDRGVQAMVPVRIVTPGTDATLPLRMMAAGAAPNVDITLWVIAEARYQAQSFPNALFTDDAKLVSAADGGSNLPDLERALMAQNDGRTWVTEYAGQNFSELGLQALTAAYQSTCQNRQVQIACDAGVADSGACMQTVQACSLFDDLDVALRGLAADNVWLTRMHANLPAAALTVDLQLEPAAQTNVLPNHTIRGATCTDDGCSAAPKSALGTYALAALSALAFGSLVRRRRYSGRK